MTIVVFNQILKGKIPIQGTTQHGFSLIELSIVISVAATILVGFLSWTQPAATTNANKAIETREKIKEISKAIEAFRVQHSRLPCPADPLMRDDNTKASGENTYQNDYGMEDLDTLEETIDGVTTYGVDCPDNVGTVPVYSLELEDRYMTDAWGRRFTYHVSDTLCGADQGIEVLGANSEEASRIRGCTELDYKKNVGNIVISNSQESLSTNAGYIIISHGANGYGAYLPSGTQITAAESQVPDEEEENYDNDNNYYKLDTSTSFDDVVFFKTRVQVDRLTKNTNTRMISVDECNSNSSSLDSITFDDTTTFSQHIQDSKLGEGSSGEEVVLGIMLGVQRSCISYYGNTSKTVDGVTWNGPKCPGINSCYDTTTNHCRCKTGDWSNCDSANDCNVSQ